MAPFPAGQASNGVKRVREKLVCLPGSAKRPARATGRGRVNGRPETERDGDRPRACGSGGRRIVRSSATGQFEPGEIPKRFGCWPKRVGVNWDGRRDAECCGRFGHA